MEGVGVRVQRWRLGVYEAEEVMEGPTAEQVVGSVVLGSRVPNT